MMEEAEREEEIEEKKEIRKLVLIGREESSKPTRTEPECHFDS